MNPTHCPILQPDCGCEWLYLMLVIVSVIAIAAAFR